MKKTIIITALLIFVYSGCAFKNQKIAIEYESNGQTSNETATICLNKFSDNRLVKHRIGIVKNGMGVETADILTDQDIRILISNSIKEEMQNLGYSVKLIDVEYGKGINKYDTCDIVDGQIKEVFVEPIFSMFSVEGKAIITINMLIQTQSGKEFKKIYSSNGGATSYGGHPALFKESMDKALANLILERHQN